MKRVLITGAAGFIGANLVRRLIAEGHEVHIVVLPPRWLSTVVRLVPEQVHVKVVGNRSVWNMGMAKWAEAWRIEQLRGTARFWGIDLTDAEGVRRMVAEVKPQWIFHLAAYGAYSWQAEGEKIMRANVLGTVNLLEACLASGFEAFVNTGSSSEYGFKDHAPPEDEKPEPNSSYAVSKVAATMYCRHAARSRKARIVTLRLYSAYGPWEEPGRLVPALAVCGLEGGLPPLVDPEVARDFVYVGDVCDAYLAAASSTAGEPGAVYNVATGVQTRMSEAVEAARKVLGIREEPRWGSMPRRDWDTAVWVGDARKIERELGWKPRHDFASGFMKTVEWFRGNSALLGFYRQAMKQNPAG